MQGIYKFSIRNIYRVVEKGGERWGGDKREGEGRGGGWEGREGQGRGEGRYVILGFESLQNLKGTPFAICDLGKTFRGTPLAICDYGF